MACCTNTLDLGCFTNCSMVTTDIELANGTYTLVAKYEADLSHIVDIENDVLEFSTSWLSESRATTIKVYDANGDLVTFTIDNVIYDCLAVKINYTLSV